MRQWLGAFGLCLVVVLCVGCPTGGSSGGSKLADDWDVPVKSESAYRLTQRLLEPNYESFDGWCHTGEDVGGKLGVDPVLACAYGRFYTVDHNSNSKWGNVVQIEHPMPDGSIVYSVYAHLNEIMPEVKKGEEVYKGDQIGTIGDANDRYDPHLHFEIRDGDLPWVLGQDYALGRGYVENVYPDEVQHLRAPYLFIKMRQEQMPPRNLNTGYQEIKTNVMTGGNLLSFEYDGQLANVYQAVENGWIGWPQIYIEQYGTWQDMIIFHPDYRYRVNVRKSGVTMRLFQPDWDKAPMRDMALADFIAFGLLLGNGGDVGGVSITEVFPESLEIGLSNAPAGTFGKSTGLDGPPVLDIPDSVINKVKLPFGIDYSVGLDSLVKAKNQYQSIDVGVKYAGRFDTVTLYRVTNPTTPLFRTLAFDSAARLGISGNLILPDNY
jgi:murein DD-endopeptidase MepM/ murein hydrolase activator NlpD